ncbi:MAG TPA: hypothetical protein VF806_00965 [Anaerolineaceae bacterium]
MSVSSLLDPGKILNAAEYSIAQALEYSDNREFRISTSTNEIDGYPGLASLTAAQENGKAGDIVGVYVRDVMALAVMQQPAGEPEFVSRDNQVLTQFALPKEYGSIGLLAHNYLSGSRFFRLTTAMEVVAVYGNGRLERYKISRIERFKALNPTSAFSNFVDLADTQGVVLTSSELFRRIYTAGHQLVFQTCISENGQSSWGRIFIVATPVDSLPLTVPAMTSPQNLN